MIQLNLLPDVKLEYLKAQRTRRLVISVSTLVTLASIGLLVLLLSVWALQSKNLKDLNKDISTKSEELKTQPGIDKILTVQNQLQSLTGLHAAKPAAPKVFEVLNQVTPTQVSINSVLIDFTLQQITINGTADSLSSINKYVDTMKYTNYVVDSESGKEDTKKDLRAFNNVVLTSFGVTAAGGPTGQAASYSVTLKYEPVIFDNTKKVLLSVPSRTTTRASLGSPIDLFQAAPPKDNKGN